MGEIAMDLRLVFTIPSGKLTINGLVLGLKEAAPEVLETIMTTLLEAIESHFSQVCNRVKRIGRRWSDHGLLNWLTVCFYKIFKPELWSLQWQNTPRKLVKIWLRSIEATYQWSATIT